MTSLWIPQATSGLRIPRITASRSSTPKVNTCSNSARKAQATASSNIPHGIALDPEGNVWVADMANDRVQKFNSKGEYLLKFGSEGSGNGQLQNPRDIALDSKGNVWVADTENHRIEKFNANGEYLSQFGSHGSGNGQLTWPEGIAIDPKGDIWVSDTSTAASRSSVPKANT